MKTYPLFLSMYKEDAYKGGSDLQQAGSIPIDKGISKGNSVSLCLGCSEGIEFPFDRKNPKKPAVSWHTTFPGKSSVLYLCGADGSRNCSTPRKVWLQLRRSGGKGCPLRGGMSDRKRMAGGANMHCLPSLSSAEQRYIKAPSAAAYHRIRTTTAASRADCPSPRPQPSSSGSR